MNPSSLGIGVSGNQFSNLNEIDVTSAEKSQDALDVAEINVDRYGLEDYVTLIKSNLFESVEPLREKGMLGPYLAQFPYSFHRTPENQPVAPVPAPRLYPTR